MKAKVKKNDLEIPFDPVLFAATVPARKPTPKDLADVKNILMTLLNFRTQM